METSVRVNGEITRYKWANSHLVTFDYTVTGAVEIAVTFSSEICNKTTVTNYTSKTNMLHVHHFSTSPLYS